MISYLEGQVLFIDAGYAVVKTGGVGYHVLLHKKALESLSKEQSVSFFIHTHVREDAFELYGFQSAIERQLFLLLISVSGVGPKLGLAALSCLDSEDILKAISEKDIALLSSIPGIGKKTAERLSLELKEKALKMTLPLLSFSPQKNVPKTNLDQAIRSLGYSKMQSERALSSLTPDDFTLPFEELIRKTLNVLTGNKLP